MYCSPIPKPKLKKQRKAKNNPKPTDQDLCKECGMNYAATHEVFFGTGQRQLSIKYGMQVKLCYYHHRANGDELNGIKQYGVHFNRRQDLRYKQQFQQLFEYKYGHEKFMQTFMKDYIKITYEEYIKQGVA